MIIVVTVVIQYTISASNTWEKKIITFPADTTGQYDCDADLSMEVNMGSTSTDLLIIVELYKQLGEHKQMLILAVGLLMR